MDEIIQHLAVFVSRLWQIHIFSEGNTRTTAVFFIKSLRTLGFLQQMIFLLKIPGILETHLFVQIIPTCKKVSINNKVP